MKKDFLPISKEDMQKRKIKQLDFVYVSGDAYVDHPSFGHAIITRVLESEGFTVGIIAQPNWKDCEEFKKLGAPKYAFLVSAGNIDSMVNHYTVNKKIRHTDLYSPGGEAFRRPDRATIVYCNRIREAYPNAKIIIGGVEASLRRFAHYDYWDNKVRRSIIFDSRADILTYGMGEKIITELAHALKDGKEISETDIDGCVYVRSNIDYLENYIEVPSFEEVSSDKVKYAKATADEYYEQDPIRGRAIVQKCQGKYLVQNKPMMPLSTSELDRVYSLPYMRTYHPIYEKDGGVPAIKEVKFSITNTRGCYGGCNFCALTFHQGRMVTSRSEKSVLKEAESLTHEPDFKGYIHDVGGPTANFYGPACKKQLTKGTCRAKRCLYPEPCKNLEIDHKRYMRLLQKMREIPKIKKVFIRSGIRYDYLIHDKNEEFFYYLAKNHVSGQLKVAPEHISDNVLSKMGKPSRAVYDKFADKFYEINKKIGKEQYLVPYLMSSHPGSTLNEAIELAEYIKAHNLHPEQVQDFYPTPFTISTCMFYTGLDPFTLKEVYVPRTFEEKQMQRALLQFTKKENYTLVLKALKLAHREDLIGYGKNCLIRPPKPLAERERAESRQNSNHGAKQKGRKQTGSRQNTKQNNKNSANRGGTKNGKNSGRKSGFAKGKKRS